MKLNFSFKINIVLCFLLLTIGFMSSQSYIDESPDVVMNSVRYIDTFSGQYVYWAGITWVGRLGGSNGSSTEDIYRTAVQFDRSEIPANSTIDSAHISTIIYSFNCNDCQARMGSFP